MSTVKETKDPVLRPLPDGSSLEVSQNGLTVFQSGGKWLYPLFELERTLWKDSLNRETLLLHDKIAGRAAAALICRMGIVRCHIDLVSRLALETFETYGVACTYTQVVDKIQCHTEEIIHSTMSLDEMYRILRKRAKLIQGIDIDISGLEAGYPGKTVLKDFNLSLSSGEQLVLTGDNGAGKTTLIKTIIGALPVRKGSIVLGKSGEQETKPKIGYVTQSVMNTPFPIAADEVVAMGLIGESIHGEELRYQIEIAMRRTGCFHLYGKNFYKLSGGERQRVSLARCLCQKAGLILMDEPTSFLDAESKEDLKEVLGHIINHQMPTVLLVSHDHDWTGQLGWPVRRLEKGRLC